MFTLPYSQQFNKLHLIGTITKFALNKMVYHDKI
jgi:hypothetical protein